jgi:hypothetical protein
MSDKIDISAEAVERLADRMDFHAMQQLEYDCANTLRALVASLAEVEAERDRQYDENVHRIAEQAKAEAKLAKAVKALRPFSDEASWWFTRNYSESDVPVEGFADYESVMTVGDLFKARATLAELKGEKDE